jgi:hypothetical protein
MRRWVASLLCFVWFPLGAGAEPKDVTAGIRQVKDGDLEAGVATLEAATGKMTGDPARRRDLARAHLYIGIAKVGLSEPRAAQASFLAALALDSSLRLSSLEFSPRVVDAFDRARREAPPTDSKSGGSLVPILAAGAGVAGAGAIVLASGGGEDEGPPVARFSDARFAAPTIVCTNAPGNTLINVGILVTATNNRDEAVTISQVESGLTIVASPFADEIGLTSRRPTSFLPGGVAARSTITLRIDTTIVCTNDFGNAERWNNWSAEVSIASSAATAILRTADILRVEIP